MRETFFTTEGTENTEGGKGRVLRLSVRTPPLSSVSVSSVSSVVKNPERVVARAAQLGPTARVDHMR